MERHQSSVEYHPVVVKTLHATLTSVELQENPLPTGPVVCVGVMGKVK